MKCVDIFSGCGGMSLGFGAAGFEVVAAIDNWDEALEVYSDNFDHQVIRHDLGDEEVAVKLIREFSPNIIIGGPPCQDFSSAGKRNETLGRADLTYSFAEIVCQIMPDWFVMENVQRIVKSRILSDVIEQYSAAGYGLTAVILDASYCGAPQARRRFFLIGHINDGHNFLTPLLAASLSESPMTMRNYFGDRLGIDYYYRHPRNYNRRAIYSMDEPSATIRGVNRPVPRGYQRHPLDPVNIAKVAVRPLTTAERAQVQTFPKRFKFVGTKTKIEQMIGNAVPPILAKFVAKAILSYENMKEEDRLSSGRLFELDDVVEFPRRPLCRTKGGSSKY